MVISKAIQRPTTKIQRKPASHLKKAERVAVAIGRPLNTIATINCSAFALQDQDMSKVFRHLVGNYFGPWIRRSPSHTGRESDGPAAYIWAIENPSGIINIHWMVHIPSDRRDEFDGKLRMWIDKCFGPTSNPGTLDLRPAHKSLGAVKYLLKGMDPAVAEHYGVVPLDQGTVFGKRSGFSKSLGPAVRKDLEKRGIMKKSHFTPFAR